jgi:hypothetical protein
MVIKTPYVRVDDQQLFDVLTGTEAVSLTIKNRY